jgi:hypothetical protein
MSFKVGSILFFDRYEFTDKKEVRKHFGLVLLPEHATRYQNSILCAVVTSKKPHGWDFLLQKNLYTCFLCDSFACFDRKDLVSKTGLNPSDQPRAVLTKDDLKSAFKILKKSLFVIDDMAKSPFLRGVIIYQWKKEIGC